MNKVLTLSISLLIMLLISCSGGKNNTAEKFYLTHRKLTNIDKLGPAFMQKLSEDLYKAVIDGKITAYKSDSLNETNKYTKEKVAEIGKIEEVIQYYPDPSYPDYYIDSLVVIPFSLKDIKGFEISEKWTKDKGSKFYRAEINAIALRYIPVFGGVQLREQAMFWVKFDDLEKIVGRDDLKAMTDLIFESLTDKVSEY